MKTIQYTVTLCGTLEVEDNVTNEEIDKQIYMDTTDGYYDDFFSEWEEIKNE